MTVKEVLTTGTLKTEGDQEGYLEAVISTFDVVDRGNDIVLSTAFTDGQEVILCWAHDWKKPIGKGRISVEPGRAVFKGSFWLDTDDGLQAYRKVKNAGSLQQYSWGFEIIDADFAEREGRFVQIIKRTEVFEASPVLIGEGRDTQTLTIKSLADSALTERLPLDAHVEQVQAANATLAKRLRSHADLKTRPTATQKEGRVLSEANRERIKRSADSTREIADDLDALHASTAPQGDGKEARALRGAALRRIAEGALLAG